MGKKFFSWLFLLGFFAMTLTLSLGMLLFGPSTAGANEILAQPPKVLDRDGAFNQEVLADGAAYLADHFYLRKELISLNDLLSAHIFGVSGAEDVIVGREGWLYYAPTLEGYTGAASLGPELENAAENLALMAQYCAENGRQFLFCAAPNKNSLYPAWMPSYGAVAQERDIHRLFALLEEKQVPYLDLYALFDGEEEVLYYVHDSHWNQKGAALAADAINAAFGLESDYYSGPFDTAAHRGDLYEMLYPSQAFADPETGPVYAGALTFTYDPAFGDKPDSITIVTQGPGTGSLLAYRDSFGNDLHPYLASSFAFARFSRSVSFDLTLPGEKVLIELVERNLRYLVANVPKMPAPVRDLTLPTASGQAETPSYNANGAPEGLTLVRGVLPEGAAPGAAYLICGGKAYQVFRLENGGYGAYVPAEEPATAVACTLDGQIQVFSISE